MFCNFEARREDEYGNRYDEDSGSDWMKDE